MSEHIDDNGDATALNIEKSERTPVAKCHKFADHHKSITKAAWNCVMSDIDKIQTIESESEKWSTWRLHVICLLEGVVLMS